MDGTNISVNLLSPFSGSSEIMVPSVQCRSHMSAQPHHNRQLCDYLKWDLWIYFHRVLCYKIREAEAASFNKSFFLYQNLAVIFGYDQNIAAQPCCFVFRCVSYELFGEDGTFEVLAAV